MKTNIGISPKNITHIVTALAEVLSDEMILYTKTRKAHWNVTGESFMELHKLFEAQYKQTEEDIDAVAERINKLGTKTMGTMTEFIKHSSPGVAILSALRESRNFSCPEQAPKHILWSQLENSRLWQNRPFETKRRPSFSPPRKGLGLSEGLGQLVLKFSIFP